MAAAQDPRFVLALFGGSTPFASIAPQGGGTFQSSFTQANPGPGEPVPEDAASRWRPTLVGAQSVALTLATVHGGYAGVDGARSLYRLATDSDPEDYRGWSEPNLPVHWDAPASGWGAAASFGPPAGVALPSGKVAVIAADDTLTTEGQSWTYDPRTETWTDKFDWSTGPGLAPPVAMAYDPGVGRLIAWSGSGTAGSPTTRAYSSTDDGLTWQLYSRGMYGATVADTDRLRVSVDPGGADWLAISGDKHFASNDRGVTWTAVETLTGASGTTAYVPIRTTGGWLVAYIKTGTNLPTVRLLSSPGSLFGGAVDIEVSETTTAGDLVGCTDADGVVYVLCRGTSGATTRHQWSLHRSTDGGATWATYSWRVQIGDDDRIVNLMDLVASNGQLHLVYTQGGGASGDVAGTVAVITLGGWSQLEHGSGATSSSLGKVSRFTYGELGVGTLGQFWFPYTLPEAMGWTRLDSDGTRDFDTAIPGMRLTTVAGDAERYQFEPAALGGLGFTCGEAILRTIAGGTSATLADIGTTNIAVHIQPRLGNAGATALYAPLIDIGTDGIQVRDGSNIRATVAVDTTDFRIHIRWMLRPGAVSVWYRKKGTHRPEQWVLIADDVAVTDTGGTDAAGVIWGNSTTKGDAIWGMVGVANGGEWLSGLDGAAQAHLTSADGVRGMRWGRSIPGAGGGYPLPEATAVAEELGHMAATGGPTRAAEIVELPVAYERGIHHIDPEQSPSPRTRWLAASDALQSIVHDLGEPAWHGGALLICALNVRTPTITAELDNGAGGWSAATTLSMALVPTWNYTLTGRVAVPRTGTDVVDRYIGEGELAGAWGLLETSGAPAYRPVVANSGGYLTTDATVQQVRLTFGDLDGTEVAAGSGTLYHHSAVHLAFPSSDTPRRYVRLRAAAVGGGGPVPGAGILAVARVVAIGADPEWQWMRTLELERTMRRAGDGTPSVTRRGPPREVWSYPFTGGIALGHMRLLASGAHRVQASGGVPIGTAEDAVHSWWGVIEHALRSGEVPCVLVPRAAAGTIFDPTQYVYGLLAAESVTVTSVVGTEGVDEILRLSSPTVERIR